MPRWQVPRERLVTRVEHHLLALARIGLHVEHPAVAEPPVGDFQRRCHPRQQHDLVASRTDPPRPAQSSAAHPPPPPPPRARGPAPARSAGRHNSRRDSPIPEVPRKSAPGSAAHAAPCARSPPAARPAPLLMARAWAAAARSAYTQTPARPIAAPCAPCCANPQSTRDLLNRLAFDQRLAPDPRYRLHDQRPRFAPAQST